MDDECINAIKDMINLTLETSFSDEWKEEQEELKQFGMKYMMVLLPKIMQLNTIEPENIESIKKKRLMERVESKKDDN